MNNHYLYTGQEYDSDISGSELYNLRARYYDPKVGRFMSEDKVSAIRQIPQSTNKYLYVRNMPLSYIDPTGLIMHCTPLVNYPVRSWTETIGERRISNWELVNAVTQPEIEEVSPIPIYVIFCIWKHILEITRTLRLVTEWAYVEKCYEKCSAPVIRSKDVIIYGPTFTQTSTKMEMVTRPLYGRIHSISEPFSKEYLMDWCEDAGPPKR